MPKYLIIIRALNGGSPITRGVELDEIVRQVVEDRSDDNPTFEEAKEWVLDWFENPESSVDSNCCDRYGVPLFTIVRVS